MVMCRPYTVKNSKHGVVTWRCVRRDHPVQCPAIITTSSMQTALLHRFPKFRPKRPLFAELKCGNVRSRNTQAEASGPKHPLAQTSVHRLRHRQSFCGFVSLVIRLLVARPAMRSWVFGDGRQIHTGPRRPYRNYYTVEEKLLP